MEKVCWNSKCGAAASVVWRTGWILRSGRVADLCDSCGSAYEQLIFCETFHSEEDGWKDCNTCKKRFHCGCIASIHLFILLDGGGIECINCAKKNNILNYALNQTQQLAPFLFPSQTLPDLPIKSWNDSMGARISQYGGNGLGQWKQHPDLQQPSIGRAEVSLFPQMPVMDRSNDIGVAENNKWEALSASKLNKMDVSVFKRKGIYHSEPEDSGESNAIPEAVEEMNESESGREEPMQKIFSFEGGHTKGMTNSCLQTGMTSLLENFKCREVNSERENLEVSKVDSKVLEKPATTSSNISLGFSTPKDAVEVCNNLSSATIGLGISSGSPEQNIAPSAYYQYQRQSKVLPKVSYASPSTGSESSKDMHPQIRIARPPGEGRGRNQLLPRYWPRSTDQELQLISRDSNSSITELFQKVLSASDAGRIGRLVLPKACAEKYFPPISQPEGVPLTVQDCTGKDWLFQFRYWPNNNSRMYVLEGVTPCIQAMQLQAGDTVTFNRLDPEGKLVMGFRKGPNSGLVQEGQPSASGLGAFLSNGFNSGSSEILNVRPLSSMSGKEESHIDSLTDKKRSRNLCAKNKRLRMDNEDAFELKLTWEEAQDLLHPPPNAVPSIVMIEDHEFEEYEEPPMLCKKTIFTVKQSGEQDQWVQCDECGRWRRLPLDVKVPIQWTCADNSWDSKRASCSTPQEISSAELEERLHLNIDLKKQKAAQGLKGQDPSSGLDTLANAAVLNENGTSPPLIAQTTKHPRHRPGCTCIVCSQPPSGMGPKHKPTCTCTVCLTVKRRFQTLMMRRKKRQSEQDAEKARKRQTLVKEEVEVDSALKGQPSNHCLENGCSDGDGKTVHSKVPGNGVTLPMGLNLQASYNSSRTSKDECGVSKGQIDLNCHPDREEELSGGVDRVSMLRLLQDANLPLDIYFQQQGFMSPELVSMPMGGFQNNPSEQTVDEKSCIPPKVQNGDHNKEDHLFLPNTS